MARLRLHLHANGATYFARMLKNHIKVLKINRSLKSNYLEYKQAVKLELDT